MSKRGGAVHWTKRESSQRSSQNKVELPDGPPLLTPAEAAFFDDQLAKIHAFQDPRQVIEVALAEALLAHRLTQAEARRAEGRRMLQRQFEATMEQAIDLANQEWRAYLRDQLQGDVMARRLPPSPRPCVAKFAPPPILPIQPAYPYQTNVLSEDTTEAELDDPEEDWMKDMLEISHMRKSKKTKKRDAGQEQTKTATKRNQRGTSGVRKRGGGRGRGTASGRVVNDPDASPNDTDEAPTSHDSPSSVDASRSLSPPANGSLSASVSPSGDLILDAQNMDISMADSEDKLKAPEGELLPFLSQPGSPALGKHGSVMPSSALPFSSLHKRYSLPASFSPIPMALMPLQPPAFTPPSLPSTPSPVKEDASPDPTPSTPDDTPLSARHARPSDSSMVVSSTVPFEATSATVRQGQLKYRGRWYHSGDPVFMETQVPGRHHPPCAIRTPGFIHSITNSEVWLEKVDGSRKRLYITHLRKGKYVLLPQRAEWLPGRMSLPGGVSSAPRLYAGRIPMLDKSDAQSGPFMSGLATGLPNGKIPLPRLPSASLPPLLPASTRLRQSVPSLTAISENNSSSAGPQHADHSDPSTLEVDSPTPPVSSVDGSTLTDAPEAAEPPAPLPTPLVSS